MPPSVAQAAAGAARVRAEQEAAMAMLRRRRLAAVPAVSIARAIVVQTEERPVLLRRDLLNAGSADSGALEVQITIDSSGGIRLYIPRTFANTQSCLVDAVSGNDFVRKSQVDAAILSLTGTFLTILAGYSTVGHTHPGTAVEIDGAGWSGILAGSGVNTAQELADWIDANL